MEKYKNMNGALMRKYPHVLGRIFVNVKDTLAGGMKIQGTTTDKHSITLEMDTALTQPLQGWFEAIGRPSKSDTFQCREIICFEQNENAQPLDEDACNEICYILDFIGDNMYAQKME